MSGWTKLGMEMWRNNCTLKGTHTRSYTSNATWAAHKYEASEQAHGTAVAHSHGEKAAHSDGTNFAYTHALKMKNRGTAGSH